MGLRAIGSSLADAIGTALLCIRPSSPREPRPLRLLGVLRTSIIVTMRKRRLSVVPAAAVRGRRADRLVFAPLEPLDVLAALVFMSQMAALPRHVERLAPALVQRDKKVGAGVAVRDRKVRVRHFRARGRRRRQVVAAAHGCA